MSVYIDNMEKPYKSRTGRIYKLNHMIADTDDELFEMAKKIGLKMDWFQPKSFPHFDVTIVKKKEAIKLGAIAVTTRELIIKKNEILNRNKS